MKSSNPYLIGLQSFEMEQVSCQFAPWNVNSLACKFITFVITIYETDVKIIYTFLQLNVKSRPVDSILGLMKALCKSKMSNMTVLQDVLDAACGMMILVAFRIRPSSTVTHHDNSSKLLFHPQLLGWCLGIPAVSDVSVMQIYDHA